MFKWCRGDSSERIDIAIILRIQDAMGIALACGMLDTCSVLAVNSTLQHYSSPHLPIAGR
jgi:hypothetical protein